MLLCLCCYVKFVVMRLLMLCLGCFVEVVRLLLLCLCCCCAEVVMFRLLCSGYSCVFIYHSEIGEIILLMFHCLL